MLLLDLGLNYGSGSVRGGRFTSGLLLQQGSSFCLLVKLCLFYSQGLCPARLCAEVVLPSGLPNSRAGGGIHAPA